MHNIDLYVDYIYVYICIYIYIYIYIHILPNWRISAGPGAPRLLASEVLLSLDY